MCWPLDAVQGNRDGLEPPLALRLTPGRAMSTANGSLA
jgi:hypothetical protein